MARTATPTRPTRTRTPKAPVTTVVGTMGTHTTGTQVKAPKAQAKAPAPKVAKPQAKAVPASRQLPRDLLVAVATWAGQAGLSAADRQRVANYLKVVTSGTDAQGNRYWPTQADLPKGTKPLPRPTHISWSA